jgi:hypothetical protein
MSREKDCPFIVRIYDPHQWRCWYEIRDNEEACDALMISVAENHPTYVDAERLDNLTTRWAEMRAEQRMVERRVQEMMGHAWEVVDRAERATEEAWASRKEAREEVSKTQERMQSLQQVHSRTLDQLTMAERKLMALGYQWDASRHEYRAKVGRE